jgi:hypothetical protein
MKVVKKRIGLLLLAVTVIAVMAAILWPKPREAPQIITMPDGQKWQFIGTTYGTNHVMGSAVARLVNHLPPSAAKYARKLFGTRLGQITTQQTTEPSLCVWFRPLVTNLPVLAAWSSYPSITAKLADEQGVEGGTKPYVPWIANRAVSPLGIFQVVPRRSRELQLCFYRSFQAEPIREIDRVCFANPLYGRYPQWRPEPVPAVKHVGDLEARLENMVVTKYAGAWQVNSPNLEPLRKGDEAMMIFNLTPKSLLRTNDVWVVHGIELYDITGNRLRTVAASLALDRKLGSGNDYTISGILWPDEAAWRLRVEFKRAPPFAPDELITFKNLSVPKIGTTNGPVTTNTIDGTRVVLTCHAPLFRSINPGPDIFITVEAPGRAGQVALDFVELKTDTGERMGQGYSQEARVDVQMPRMSTNASTMNITFAVQKTRSVEFLVKPPGRK